MVLLPPPNVPVPVIFTVGVPLVVVTVAEPVVVRSPPLIFKSALTSRVVPAPTITSVAVVTVLTIDVVPDPDVCKSYRLIDGLVPPPTLPVPEIVTDGLPVVAETVAEVPAVVISPPPIVVVALKSKVPPPSTSTSLPIEDAFSRYALELAPICKSPPVALVVTVPLGSKTVEPDATVDFFKT